MNFIAGVVALTILAFLVVELWEMYKKDRAKREAQKQIEEEAREQKRSRIQIWGGDKDFWE